MDGKKFAALHETGEDMASCELFLTPKVTCIQHLCQHLCTSTSYHCYPLHQMSKRTIQVTNSFEQELKSVAPPESCPPCGKCDRLVPFNSHKVSRRGNRGNKAYDI